MITKFKLTWEQLDPIMQHWDSNRFMYLGLSNYFDPDLLGDVILDQETWKMVHRVLYQDPMLYLLTGTRYAQEWRKTLEKVNDALNIFVDIRKRLNTKVDNLEFILDDIEEDTPEYAYAEALGEKADDQLQDLSLEIYNSCYEIYELLRDKDLEKFRPEMTEAERQDAAKARLQAKNDALVKAAQERLQALAVVQSEPAVDPEDPDGVA